MEGLIELSAAFDDAAHTIVDVVVSGTYSQPSIPPPALSTLAPSRVYEWLTAHCRACLSVQVGEGNRTRVFIEVSRSVTVARLSLALKEAGRAGGCYSQHI